MGKMWKVEKFAFQAVCGSAVYSENGLHFDGSLDNIMPKPNVDAIKTADKMHSNSKYSIQVKQVLCMFFWANSEKIWGKMFANHFAMICFLWKDTKYIK